MIERTRWLKDLLWILVFCGTLAIVFRLWFGLGATTNLSDAVPWGLWKILNMVAGVALATGGFTVGFLVYVLRLEQFRPLVKPAITLAFLGYGSSVFALLLDIGLPHRIWHPIVMWNEHSFLFEVAWCVMLYTTVLTLLQRLQSKGYVTSEKAGVALVFQPLVSREKLLRHRLWELADQLAGGTATPLVHALVEGHQFSEEEIEDFRRMLDELESQKRQPKKS